MAESDEAALLKRRARRRLIGAVAVVVFVVIALPMLFDKEPKPITHDLEIRIPSQDTPFNPPAAPPAPEAQAPERNAALPPGKPAEKPPPSKPAAAQPATHTPARPSSSGFVVPLGAYSNAANARRVRKRVTAAGFKSLMESIKGRKGGELRVRAGPFASRKAAERARRKLVVLGLKPVGAVVRRGQP